MGEDLALAITSSEEDKRRLEKEVTRRTNAQLQSQADHALRIAVEESNVFDAVPKYISDKVQEERDVNRFLDAATYRLQEVNQVQKEILRNEFTLALES